MEKVSWFFIEELKANFECYHKLIFEVNGPCCVHPVTLCLSLSPPFSPGDFELRSIEHIQRHVVSTYFIIVYVSSVVGMHLEAV